MYRIKIRSRHPSHSALRKILPKLPYRSVVRFGSETDLNDTVSNGGKRIEINTIEAVRNSANKLRMKTCFTQGKVPTAKWQTLEEYISKPSLEFPIVVKHIFGSRNKSNFLIKDKKEFESCIKGKTTKKYIVEEFKNFTREYRLHVTKNGCFYSCRKMIKEDTPKEQRWFRNDSNSVWIIEENPSFDRPSNWKTIEKDCVNALKSVGLDVGAVDLKVQSSTNKKGEKRKDPEYIVIEINSAPSFGDITLKKYKEIIPKLITEKK